MEENMELKDIILDKDGDEKRGKLTKFLVYAAIGLIIFIIIMIIMKVLSSSDDGSKKAPLVLPNEPQQARNSGIIKSSDMFEQVPILPEKKSEDSFEKTISDLKVNKITKEEEKIEIPKPEPSVVKIEPQKELTPVVIKPEPKKPEVEVKKVEKVEPKKQEKPKPSVKKESISNGIAPGNYIQVLSVSKINLSDSFLKKLSASGYSYKVYQTSVNGKTLSKVLVGPYNASDLKENLAKIRANFVSDAFVYRVK